MVNWSNNFKYKSGKYWQIPVTVTNNYSTISCSSRFRSRKSNIAMITSVDTEDWTDSQNTTVYTTGAGDFEYSIDGTYFQDSNQFLNIISGEYTVAVRDKKRLWHCNRRGLFIDVPQILYAKRRWI
jgi:hypothetical protein